MPALLSLSFKKEEYWSEDGCKKEALILMKILTLIRNSSKAKKKVFKFIYTRERLSVSPFKTNINLLQLSQLG